MTPTMSAFSVLGAAAALVTLSSFASALCPSGYQPASSDKCFKAVPGTVPYCEAQARCAYQRGRVIEGAEWLRLLADPSSAPWQVPGFNSTWTGLTDLLEERGTDKAGWLWPSEERASASEVPWSAGEPKNGGNDCTVFRKGQGMENENCSARHQVFCEQHSRSKKSPTQFVSVPLNAMNPGSVASWNEYCMPSAKVDVLDCFVQCFNQMFGCKAIYYNAEEKKCNTLGFNDVSLRLAAPWRKFKSVG